MTLATLPCVLYVAAPRRSERSDSAGCWKVESRLQQLNPPDKVWQEAGLGDATGPEHQHCSSRAILAVSYSTLCTRVLLEARNASYAVVVAVQEFA